MSEAQVTITLPDGSSKQVVAGTTIADFVRTAIGPGLAKAALFAKYDGAEVDLTAPLDHDGTLAIFTPKNPEGLDLVRHDAAHIVASVVQRLFPRYPGHDRPDHRRRLLLRLRARHPVHARGPGEDRGGGQRGDQARPAVRAA
jgi:hypothetical protein